MDFNYKNSCLIDEKEIDKTGKTLAQYLNYLVSVARTDGYQFSESSINLPFDEELLKNIQRIKKEKAGRDLKYIIVIGIGGSNLGAKAVYDAIIGYEDQINPGRFPKMVFVDTNDPEFLISLKRFLKKEIKTPEEILLNVISKSGTTTETAVNFEIIFDILQKKFRNAKERLVITTNEHSQLWRAAQEKDVSVLTLPDIIGGRFSVFSAVGLFPLAVCGIDILALIDGAKQAKARCLDEDTAKNPAALSAIILFHHAREGEKINDNFFFHPELESLGKWYRQLMAESIGKETDIDGKIARAGITPTISIGSTDLHSMGQLYFGGPRDKFTTFIHTDPRAAAKENIAMSQKMFFENLVENIEAKTAGEIMNAIFGGVKAAYLKATLPFAEILLPDISASSLGEFMQFKMMEIMILGNLMRVNVFDQPSVELYKKETKNILLNNNSDHKENSNDDN